MPVWICLPSARPAAHVAEWLKRWKDRGYKVALWRDDGVPIEGCDLTMGGAYPGYAVACNALIAHVLKMDPACDWVVCAGDDTWPDPNHTADEIAMQCSEQFAHWFRQAKILASDPLGAGADRKWSEPTFPGEKTASTFGVMQPTGDPWSDHMGRIIERIAGSPWIGREFAQRINQGEGPWWSEYFHSWADQEMQEVCQKLGCFWQRRDLTHFHDHCLRYPGGKWAPHLHHVSADYNRMKPVFEARKKLGFPGSEPL